MRGRASMDVQNVPLQSPFVQTIRPSCLLPKAIGPNKRASNLVSSLGCTCSGFATIVSPRFRPDACSLAPSDRRQRAPRRSRCMRWRQRRPSSKRAFSFIKDKLPSFLRCKENKVFTQLAIKALARRARQGGQDNYGSECYLTQPPHPFLSTPLLDDLPRSTNRYMAIMRRRRIVAAISVV